MPREKTMPDIDRFMAKVLITKTCWIWQAGRCNGYGRFAIGSRRDQSHQTVQAHRWLYEYVYGPIPEGFEPDHTCRVRSCVNLAHLEPISHQLNVLRGLGEAAKNYLKDQCQRGHPLTGDNLRLTKDRRRQCGTCIRARQRLRNLTEHRRAQNRSYQSSAQGKAYKRAWYHQHLETQRAYHRQWTHDHPLTDTQKARKKDIHRQWRDANRDHVRTYGREKMREYRAARRAATPTPFARRPPQAPSSRPSA